MRIARKAMLLALISMSAMAVAAGSASASTAIEFEDEVASDNCNPCELHVDGESHLARLDNGVIVSKCQNEFHIDLYHSGPGEVEWSGATHAVPGPGCNSVNCTAMSRHWRIHSVERVGTQIRFHVEVCLRNLIGTEVECEVVVTATPTATHRYGFAAAQVCPTAGIRIELAAAGEPGEGFETHDDPPPDPIEFEDELTGGSCNPCELHVDGESHLARLDTGAIVSKCRDEFHIDIYHSGTGEVEWGGVTHATPGPGCNSVNCTVMSPHWAIHRSERVDSSIRFHIEICLRSAAGVEGECEVVVTETPVDTHRYSFSASQACPLMGVRLELVAAGEGFEAH